MRKTRGNKKKDRKMRILALFLCFAMLIGSLGNFFSISVLATSDDDVIVTESEQVSTETESESFVSTEVLSETEPAVVSSEEEIVESECSVDLVPAETEELPSAETESDTESTPSSEDFSDGSSEVLTEAITEFASESESETETIATEQTEHVSESKELESEIVESIPMESETEPMSEVLSDGLDDTPMAKPEFISHAAVDGIKIQIHAPEGVLPEGVTVQVKPLADNVLDQASNSISEWVANETLVQLIGFDICFFDSDGEALHQFDRNIEVTYSGWNDVEKANAMQVFHAESSGNITESLTEPLEISDQVTFCSNTFSPILLAMYGAEEDEEISDLNTEIPDLDEPEDVYHQIMIHDVQPNGSEAGQVLDLSVGHGMTLSDALLDVDTVLNDGTELTNCIWYTIGTNGENTVVDLSSVVATDMELYTYTYDADFSVGDTVIFHTSVREGFPLSVSDFVFDGVDYGMCRWTTEDGDVIDVAHLIQNGLTENITAVSTGVLATAGLFRYAGHMVNFYVFVDEERVLLDARRVTSYYYNSRYYLSAGTLESVYGDCGFTAQQLTPGTHYFPHVDAGGATIWADTSVLEWGGFCYSPINNNTGTVDVYYFPNQSVTNTGLYWDYLTVESFYSVTVEDAMHQVYEADELPDPVYTQFGGTATVAVRNGEHVVWQCVGQDGVPIEGEEQDDGTTVFTIPDIAQPYVISPARQDGETFLTYDIHLPEYPLDEEYGTPEIEGGSTYSVLETSETHVVLAPSLTSYFYDSEKYLGEATFLGWVVNGNENQVVQPGDRLDLTLYDGDVTLRGSWSTKLGGTSDSTGSMINFFVSLDALPEGTVSWTGHTETANFTFSVYTADCGVNADTAVQQGLYDNISGGQYFVLGGTSGTDLNENHQIITNRLTDGYTLEGNDGASYTYRADFPTDEEVLLKVRQMVSNGTSIVINGHRITEDELTTTNFTIKWYVFKYDDSDGWHIDGILVTKTGEMVVTKTFAGDPEAISNVKEQYSIRVNGEAGATHDGATLTLADAVQVDDQTFSWTVDVDQYFDYVVTENEYLSEDPLITTMAQYNVRNSDVESQNTHGWVDYDTGVTVTGCGYSPGVSERQTVSFLNTYTAPGTLVLRKVDAGTGNLMPDVAFLISKDGSENFGVYSIGNGRYTADPAGQSGEKVTEIVTDSSGQAYLYVGGGIYRFTEIVPDGYDDPGTIVAELEGDPENAYKIVTITNVSADGGDSFVASNGLTLTVNNQSRTVDLHVKKIWADGENKPVTLQLYRSGVSMGNAYRVTFDGVLDDIETVSWNCVFSNLPLYSDGGLAEYSIREVVLGDFRYSSEYPDGYQYYDVRYSGMSYLDDTGSVTDVMADVRTISLNVTNRRTIGELVIDKVNEDGDPLSGAVFALYSMEDGEIPTREELEQQTPAKTVTSDANGHVSFGRVNAGEYYVIELSAPDGYVKSEQIYRVVFDGSDVFLYEYQDDAWEQLSENRIVNQRDTVRLTIEKQVTGDLGDRNKAFSFTYRYRNGTSFVTGTFSLKDDETYLLENIPAGTELSLTETNADEYEISGVYGVDGKVQTATDGELTFVVRAEDQKIVITNRLEAIPDTGVTVDVVPYVILLSVIVLCAMSFRFHQKDREE